MSNQTGATRPAARMFQSFPTWLEEQVCRRDRIGHLARIATAKGEIDRTDTELLNEALVEWSQA